MLKKAKIQYLCWRVVSITSYLAIKSYLALTSCYLAITSYIYLAIKSYLAITSCYLAITSCYLAITSCLSMKCYPPMKDFWSQKLIIVKEVISCDVSPVVMFVGLSPLPLVDPLVTIS